MTCGDRLSGRVGSDASTDGRVLSSAVDQLQAELMTFDMVEARLAEAWGFLMRMPDRERGWQRIQAMWPDVRRHTAFGDYGDMTPDARPRMPGLRSAEVDRMEQALGWMAWVGERDRKLVGIVLAQLQRVDRPEWEAVADRIGGALTSEACRKRYGRALNRICVRLNAAEIRGVEAVNP